MIVGTNEQNILICSHRDPLYMLYLALIKEKNLPNELEKVEDENYQEKGSVRSVIYQADKQLKIQPILIF